MRKQQKHSKKTIKSNASFFDWRNRNQKRERGNFQVKNVNQKSFENNNSIPDVNSNFYWNTASLTQSNCKLEFKFALLLLLLNLLPTLSETVSVADQYNTSDLSSDVSIQHLEDIESASFVGRQVEPAIKTKFSDQEILNRIVLSEKTLSHYSSKETLVKDLEQLKELIQELSEKDNAIYCKLVTCFADPDFHFQLCSESELGGERIHGSFSLSSKTLMISYKHIYDAHIESIVYHELHHALMFFQNQPIPSALPCLFSTPQGRLKPNADVHTNTLAIDIDTDCYTIKQLQDFGINRIKNLLELLDEESQSGSDNLNKNIQKYKELVTDYKPLKLRPSSEETDSGTALRDFLYSYEHIVSKYEKGEYGISRMIMEIDATIHHTFEAYPKLFKFLFPRLEEYHLNRSDNAFQQCMRAK